MVPILHHYPYCCLWAPNREGPKQAHRRAIPCGCAAQGWQQRRTRAVPQLLPPCVLPDKVMQVRKGGCCCNTSIHAVCTHLHSSPVTTLRLPRRTRHSRCCMTCRLLHTQDVRLLSSCHRTEVLLRLHAPKHLWDSKAHQQHTQGVVVLGCEPLLEVCC